MMLHQQDTRIRRRFRTRNGLTVATSEAMADALQHIPKDMPWGWSALRVMPTVRGERIQVMEDIELEELGFRPSSTYPSVHLPPGVDVTFAVDVDVVSLHVDQRQLDVWDMPVEQVLPVAMSNLRRTVGTWKGRAYRDTYEGVPVRMLKGWPAWASSLVLLPDELKRIFGEEDQIFVAPYTCNLISLPGDTDPDLAADVVDLFGLVNPPSLLIGMPLFRLRDGQLSTEELPGFPDLPEDDDDADDEPW